MHSRTGDVQDDQQAKTPEELPVTGAGGLARGAAVPVGNAATGLSLLAGGGYAVLRRRFIDGIGQRTTAGVRSLDRLHLLGGAI